MDTFMEQEQKIRNQFIQTFKKWFFAVKETTDPYCQYDLDATGNTYTKYKFELKERGDKYSIHDYSGKTWIEKTKIDYFKEVLEKNPEIQIRYFVYFKEGYISFDINNRFKVFSSEVLHSFRTMGIPSTTLGDTYKIQKHMCSLAANIIEYADKIVVY